MANNSWISNPNWYLYHHEFIVACWYCATKREAKALAAAYVTGAKKNNKLKPMKLRVYKKNFRLSQLAKGADDA